MSSPHDHNRRPCLPSHLPLCRRAWSNWPVPTRHSRCPTRCAWPGSSPVCRSTRSPWPAFALIAIVAAAAASVLAGARSLTEATEWIADAPHWVLLALGFSIDPFSKTVTVPHPTRVMRLLGRLDGDALDAAVSEFLQTRGESVQSGRRLRAVSVDGKVLRGSRSGGGKAVWLPAAMDRTGTVLGRARLTTRAMRHRPSSPC
ncbi:transposase family protein [Streptomyces sp. NPDC002589]|uniref:transposase family protein n=1 Tax=Streptomyces sp. NPDC002589 TaxID=3154420 RepID=UPI0033329216